MQKKILEILVTNDDGYNVKGIKEVTEIMSKYGNVTVIAPYEGQSGKSTSLTLDKPIRFKHIDTIKCQNGHTVRSYILTGTPADCIKMAMNSVFSRDNKPDLVVSGINHGSNASIASIYSGTLGAAAEATVYGIPAIGLSIDSHDPNADFSPIREYIDRILKLYFEHKPEWNVYLNINFPDIPVEKIKGIKFAAQGDGLWINEFEKRVDPHGREYYWMCGEFLDRENSRDGDHTLLNDGYITIVPHRIDTTDYSEVERLSKAWFGEQ